MKYRKWRRVIGVLLTTILICVSLVGCSKDEAGGTGNEGSVSSGDNQENGAGLAEEQEMGRFLEEELDTGVIFGNIYDMKKLEDGSLRIVGSNGDNGKSGVWESTDAGKTWKSVYDLPAEVQDQENGWMDYAAISPGGQAVCAFNEIVSGGGGFRLVFYLLDKQGKIDKMSFELPQNEGETSSAVNKSVEVRTDDAEQPETGEGQPEDGGFTNSIMDLQFPGNEWVVVQDAAGTVYQINVSDGSVKYTYELDATTNAFQIYAVGNTLIAQNETEVLCYDMQTGEQKASEEALRQGGLENSFFRAVDTLDGGESIYCLSGGGLYYYKFGGSVMEQLIDGDMNSLGAPAFYPIALAMIDEQNLLVAANDTNASSATGVCILKYTYSADTPAKPDKELKMYSLYDNKEIRQSISRFQKEHTDVYINYQTALSEDNGMNVSDALKTLVTEIMAENGPDVLLLDGMPVETYIEKGVLKDLSALLKESGGSYFENIINAYQDAQGQLCAVPARFMIPMIQAGSAYYSVGEDFNAFMERKDTMVNMLPGTVVEKFWYTCGAAWQKEDKTLDQTMITEFLTKLKNAYGEYDGSLEDETSGMSVTIGGAGTESVKDVYLSQGDYDLAFGRINTNFGLSRNMDYGMQQAINEKLKDGVIDLMPGQADHVFVPAMVLGISSKSAQPEIAEEFVKYLFSQEAQKISQFGGFPVEKESFRSVIDGHEFEGQENLVSVGGADMDEMIGYAMEPTPEEEIKRMTELVETLTTSSLQDDVIKEAVVEQGIKVLKGELSPEEGAAAIMQKVNIYLAE